MNCGSVLFFLSTFVVVFAFYEAQDRMGYGGMSMGGLHHGGGIQGLYPGLEGFGGHHMMGMHGLSSLGMHGLGGYGMGHHSIGHYGSPPSFLPILGGHKGYKKSSMGHSIPYSPILSMLGGSYGGMHGMHGMQGMHGMYGR